MKRSVAREQAFILIFEKSFNDGELAELIEYATEYCGWKTGQFMERLAKGTLENLGQIDALIEESCIGWKKERIPRVSLSIMRLCCYEILYEPEIPVGVSIDEAVELAKKFASAEDASYINGVLGTIARKSGAEAQKS